jgi:hypothetical protein
MNETKRWVAAAGEASAIFGRLLQLSSDALGALESGDDAELSRVLDERSACMATADPFLETLGEVRREAAFHPGSESELEDTCAGLAERARAVQRADALLTTRLQERRRDVARELRILDDTETASTTYLKGKTPLGTTIDLLR